MMAREPTTARADRAQAAPTGASDISVYGATPIALSAPVIAMTFGGAPAAADGGAALPVTGPGTDKFQSMTLAGSDNGIGGGPFTAALMVPVVLADAAMAGMTALASRDAPDAEFARPESASEPAAISGGSGTPPGLLTPPSLAPEMIEEKPEPAGAAPASPATATVAAAQSPQAGMDAAMDAVVERIEAIDDTLESIGGRVEAIGADFDSRAGEAIETIVSNLDSQVAAIGPQITDITQGVTGALADIDLGPVGGSNPTGGITTLVGMVSAADMFDLPDIGGGVDALALPVPGIGDGDLLGGFTPADILLTVPDAHDGMFGLLAGLTDDHSGWGAA